MELDTSIADGELPKLKELAAELVAAMAPRLVLLDDIAALATAIAARSREAVRQRLLDKIGQGVQAVLPTSVEGLESRLASFSLDELSGLGELIEKAAGTQTAFEEADGGLMAARERGDYAAMAPLAIEAGKQKSALAAASAELANRIGPAGSASSDQPAAAAAETPADEPVAAGEGTPEESPGEPPLAPADSRDLEAEAAPAIAMAEGTSGPSAEAMEPRQDELPRRLTDAPQGQAEHRRIRGLIRQMRGSMDEAS